MSSSPAGTPGLSGMVGSSAFGGGASVASSSAAGAGVSKDVLRNLQDVVWSDDEVSDWEFDSCSMVDTSSLVVPDVQAGSDRLEREGEIAVE